jgi:hypothetical protein
MPDPLEQIKAYLSTDFHGCLGVGGIRIFLRDGRIVQASSGRDWMWMLRRLRCSGWIRSGEGSLLGEGRIDRRLLPHVPPAVFDQLLADRARQNLFVAARRNALLLKLDSETHSGEPLASTDSYDLLRGLSQSRASLFPLWSRMGELWAIRTGPPSKEPILSLCNPRLPLSALVARSPLEELDTLVLVQRFSAESRISIGSQQELAELTEEERGLFVDRDRTRSVPAAAPSRWLAKGSGLAPSELLTEANEMLSEMGKGCRRSPRDWILGLIGTAPSVQKAVWSSVSVDTRGLLRLQGQIRPGALEPAVHHLLVRAARSPSARPGRRRWLEELGRWEDRWQS